MFVEGYGHFLRTAAAVQWDEAGVDLSADARTWPELERALRERLLRLVAGFCVGEAAVAEDIVPFEAAAHDADAAACFGAQAVDERRHSRFFDRVATEVAKVPGRGPGERRRALRELLDRKFVELFEARLPAAARRLAANGAAGAPSPDRSSAEARLIHAVSLYHLLLEGIVFSAGQLALLRLLEGARPALPAVRRGVELVARDERWHIGLGARLLADVAGGEPGVGPLLLEGEEVAAAWGDAVDPDLVDRVLALHARRLHASAPPRAGAGAGHRTLSG